MATVTRQICFPAGWRKQSFRNLKTFVSTPIQRYRKLPNLIKELAAFKRRKWWPEVDPVSSCQHQSNDQIRYINSLRKVSSLSKAAKCLPFCLPCTFYPFKSCSTLATPNSSPLLLERGKVQKFQLQAGRQVVMAPPCIGKRWSEVLTDFEVVKVSDEHWIKISVFRGFFKF